MVLFRRLLGDVLRRHRQRQERTLRDVAAAARISLGYLSEIERGRKEASSELLGALCEALGISLADVLAEVSYDIARLERGALAPVGFIGVPKASAAALAAPAVRPVASLSAAPVAMTAGSGPVAALSLRPAARRLPVVAA